MKTRAFLVSLFLVLPGTGFAQEAAPKPITQVVPSEAQEEPLDVEKATRAYLAMLPGSDRAKSDAYFEGGYWLELWSYLVGLAAAVLLLATRLSSRMRALAEKVVPWRWLQPALCGVLGAAALAALRFPFVLYRDLIREHQYGFSNLSLAGFVGDQVKGLVVSSLTGALGFIALYAVLRRTPRTWWMWAAGVALAFSIFTRVINPVFVAPLFNEYRPVQDAAVREHVLSLARSSGLPADEVYQVDESRRDDRPSAFTTGFLGTTRIALNDNLLHRANVPQIESVMAHEMGHAIFHHQEKSMLFTGLFYLVCFACAQWAFRRLHARFGERWGVRGVEDPASWPVLMALMSTFTFFTLPLLNTWERVQEQEADTFAIAASQQPDATAQMDVSFAEWRKLDPGPVEEFIFYDHPSPKRRIQTAMRWKAEHLAELRLREQQASR